MNFEKSNILELGFESADSYGAQIEEEKEKRKDVDLFENTSTAKTTKSKSYTKSTGNSKNSA